MPPLTTLRALSRYTARTFQSTPLTRASLTYTPNHTNTFSTSSARPATQDYGSGDGNPAGENPKDQPVNPMAHLEHPGPPPPDVGQGSGSGPNKGGKKAAKSEGEGAGKSAKGKKSGGGKKKTSSGDAGTSGTSAPARGSGDQGGDASSATPAGKTGADKGSSKATESPQTQNDDGLGHGHSDEPGTSQVKNGARPRFNTGPPKDVDQADVEKHNKEVEERKAKSHEHGGEVGDEVGKGFWSGEGSRDKQS